MMKPIAHVLFCDGACSGNPGPGGWGALVVTLEGEVWEMGGREGATTNNQMELTAAIEALQSLRGRPGQANVYTDSVYVIRGVTQWIWGWQKNGWISSQGTPVANKELWQKLFSLAGQWKKGDLQWHYVRGHSGIVGNERVDQIAVAYRDGEFPALYRGDFESYHVPIFPLPQDTALPKSSSSNSSSKSKTPAFYVSCIGDLPMQHTQWSDCERRVKGRSGAKYKKVSSIEEARTILQSWGVDPKKLFP